MNKKNVLVFPAGTEISNEIFNALKHNKYFKVVFASSIKTSHAEFLNQEVYKLPYADNESFTEIMQAFISEHNIDFIIPAHDDVAYELSLITEQLEAKVIGQDRHTNKVVRFKDVTYKYFKDIIPLADVYKNQEEVCFPVFVKPKKGQGALNSLCLETEHEFNGYFNKHDIATYVLMEHLTGAEFTIDCFSDNGEVLYSGPRTREKTTRGISVLSRLIEDKSLLEEFYQYASIISKKMGLHGIWFFQMKYDKHGKLKLLEVGPRVSGTMMLNRAKGINFIELALFQAMGNTVEVYVNDVSLSLSRALLPRYKHNIFYETLYIDFDDTLYLDEKYINTDIMKLIFQAKNNNNEVILITKNKKGNLESTLKEFGLTTVFHEIIHIKDDDKKYKYMKKNSLLIDDSFQERKEAIQHGLYAYSLDNMQLLFED